MCLHFKNLNLQPVPLVVSQSSVYLLHELRDERSQHRTVIQWVELVERLRLSLREVWLWPSDQ